MKRLSIIIYSLLAIVIQLYAQTCDLPICIAFENGSTEQIPVQARQQIANKMKQILTTNGVAGDMRYSQFVMVPHVNTVDKHILAGPPVKVAMSLSVSFEIRELTEGIVMSMYSTEVNGVGDNETKAYVQGIKQIAGGNPNVKDFIEGAQRKIVEYYDKNSKNIIKKAQTLAATNQYDEALYHLMSVPECCSSYDEVSQMAMMIYQIRIDREGEQMLTEAQAIWAAGNKEDAAMRAAEILAQIDPDAGCYAKASKLLDEIKKKSSANASWSIEMRKFDAAVDIQKRKIEAAKAVGVAYGNGQQPKTTNLVFAK